jgi:micrococcal nuclease
MRLKRWDTPAILSVILALLSACIGVSGDVSPQGVEQAEVGLAVPLDRPYTFRQPKDQHLTSPTGFLRGQVVSVHDGDTLTVIIDGHTEKVRLIGIDAPELGQAPWGEEARSALRALVENKTVRLETDIKHRDQYGRLLGYIFAGETFVNLELIRQGHAVLYTVPPNVAHVDEYRKAQTEAREAGRGVWDPGQPLTLHPDCYRKQKKGQEC